MSDFKTHAEWAAWVNEAADPYERYHRKVIAFPHLYHNPLPQPRKEIMNQFRPLHDHIFVRRTAAKTQSDGGILLSDGAKERMEEGVVLATGPGKVNEHGVFIPVDLKAGERVMFGKYAGQSIKTDDGSDVLVMKEADIFAVMEN